MTDQELRELSSDISAAIGEAQRQGRELDALSELRARAQHAPSAPAERIAGWAWALFALAVVAWLALIGWYVATHVTARPATLASRVQ